MNEDLIDLQPYIFAIISKADFQQEDHYCNFLSTFEQKKGLIDNVITRRCINRSDDIILQVKLKSETL